MNDIRSGKLFSIGLIFNGEYFIHKEYKDINVHWTEMNCDTDEQFYFKCCKIEKEIEKRDVK